MCPHGKNFPGNSREFPENKSREIPGKYYFSREFPGNTVVAEVFCRTIILFTLFWIIWMNSSKGVLQLSGVTIGGSWGQDPPQRPFESMGVSRFYTFSLLQFNMNILSVKVCCCKIDGLYIFVSFTYIDIYIYIYWKIIGTPPEENPSYATAAATLVTTLRHNVAERIGQRRSLSYYFQNDFDGWCLSLSLKLSLRASIPKQYR